MVVLTAAVSASYKKNWFGDWWLVVLSIDIRTGGHVCGVRNLTTRRWSGWIGTWTFVSHHIIQVAFDDVDGMLRWQVPIRTLRARVTLISRYQLANFEQMNRYIDPHRVITVPLVRDNGYWCKKVNASLIPLTKNVNNFLFLEFLRFP